MKKYPIHVAFPFRNVVCGVLAIGAIQAPRLLAQGEEPEVFELSPFTVDAGSEDGYRATQTLSGTRLKSDLKDVGSSLTIFTEEIMNDLAANSIEDLLNYAPNTDVFVNELTDTQGFGNDFLNQDVKYVTRGGATTIVGQNFFQTGIPNDRFNTERLTFTRGPNAVLFGLGNPSGAFVSSTKQAGDKTTTSIVTQIDDRGSFRINFDHNQVLVEDRLAIRYSGLHDASNHYLPDAEGLSKRHFVTLRFKPFEKTVLRANYEQGTIDKPAVRPWPIFDGYGPWIKEGRPTRATPTTPRVAGMVNDGARDIISTAFSPGGTQIPTQSLLNQARSETPSLATGFFPSGNKLSSIDEDIFPIFHTTFAGLAARLHDYNTKSFFIEQQITDRMFVELAYNTVENDYRSFNGMRGGDAMLHFDVNEQLPDGSPNPNVGLPYVQARPTLIDGDNEREDMRAMVSYDLDFTQRDGWAQHLGRHQMAVFFEDGNEQSWSSNNVHRNITPTFPNVPQSRITHGWNQLSYRFYFEPETGKLSTAAGRQILEAPVIYAGDPIPEAHPSGITPGFVAQQGPSVRDVEVKTEALAVQSFFLNRRLVVTNGFREDTQTSWAGVPGDFTDLRDADLNNVNPRTLNPRELFAGEPDKQIKRGGSTASQGVVFHATPFMSLSYNTSNNLSITANTYDLYGNLLPNTQGDGEDFSVKFDILDRKMYLDFTYYTNSTVDKLDDIRETPAGSFLQVRDIWNTLFNETGDVKFQSPPYATIGSVWRDRASTTAKGWEFSMTAKPVKGWNVQLNGSKRGNSTTTERGVVTRQYMNEYLPIIKANSTWMNYVSEDGQGRLVSEIVAELEETLRNFDRIKDLPADVFAPNWTANLITSYRFNKESRFKGFSIGGSMNMRGKTINGFGVDSNGDVLPDKPFYAPGYEIFGTWFGYDRKILNDKVKWKFQVNVINLFDNYTVHPLRSIDTQDGNNTPSVALYTLREPRTVRITNTFSF
ncbi:hypothetical protein IEN85_19085 [Pelagicoccus sp. NFK12]|uniref:TonB-dependent receptor plug domain-containing protein n=1 Tax=Pelagicoccus enzymogenes TaxID=2773457 RepID=A0A927FB48_9BACT|nr:MULTISPECIES: hypothetical protein [Pelagicoccus]MBD5781614.1 hypothetical protein [Pelagicoccus enzymogenes]MDQ8181134.1 hypothetical protein [Pelagicoccus sp. SDUM812005]